MPCVGQSNGPSEDNLPRLVMESSLVEGEFGDKLNLN